MTGIGNKASGLEGFPGQQPGSFDQVFGEGEIPRLFQAPGRVNLMGAHLDYNGGPVMPIAIDRATWLAARTARERVLTLATTREVGVQSFDLANLPSKRTGSWVDYPLGVVQEWMAAGHRPQSGLQLMFGGDLPVGAGLSSSASLCAVAVLAFDSLWESGLESLERIEIAWRAEREFVGVPCGSLDPYAIGLARRGSVLCFECGDTSYSYAPIDLQRVGLVVVDSGVSRKLTEVGYGLRVEECRHALQVLKDVRPTAQHLCDLEFEDLKAVGDKLSPVEHSRVAHVLSELERTRAAKHALEASDYSQLGRLMFATHASLRRDFQVSCPELDHLVEAASDIEGILGARLVGAGFGGSVLILHQRGVEAEMAERLVAGFEREFARPPTLHFFAGADGPHELRTP